ncbi:hypothetical protein [Paludisphaera soli]|uniref:hypothetical protein n=1 Tax=Paludisphaera soli TaxID=2712865 RepID=UPI0013EB3296|nr:hypothetical protein [Paludisphaera soli]
MGILARLFERLSKSGRDPVRGEGRITSDHGFVDVDLPIAEVTDDGSGVVRVVARGRLDGRVVGLALDLDPSWEPRILVEESPPFHQGGGVLRRTGPESDAFLGVLARAYDRPPPRGMVDRIAVGLIGLQGDPREVLRAPIRMKAFLHPDGPEELYAEVYLNVDVAAGVFQFHDKDPEYHGALLASLAGGA